MLPRTTSMHRRALATVLLAAVALGACGGDDDDSDAPGGASATDASGATVADGNTGSAPVETASGDTVDREAWITAGADYLAGGDREFDECLSAAVVDGIGYERLEASDATPDEFWSASNIAEFGVEIGDMDAVADQLDECGDLVDYFATVSGGTDVQIECMREFFDDADVAAVIVATMTGTEPSEDLLSKQTEMRACADAESEG